MPWHSTLARLRQRWLIAVFEAGFTYVVDLQVSDSAYVKANALMSRLQPTLALWRANAPIEPASAPRLTGSAARWQQVPRR